MNSLRARRESNTRLSIRHNIISHAKSAAARALLRLGGPLSLDNLKVFLTEGDCVKYRAAIVFDRAPLSFCEMYGAALMRMSQEDFCDAIREITELLPSQHVFAH